MINPGVAKTHPGPGRGIPPRGDPSSCVSASPVPLAAQYVRLKYAKLLLLQCGLPLESAKR